jgi:hypothetical protein
MTVKIFKNENSDTLESEVQAYLIANNIIETNIIKITYMPMTFIANQSIMFTVFLLYKGA